MEKRLGDYRSKRDFDATPEPSGDAAPAGEAGERFVIQEHHARRLHWDLRLERDGVLASFALPNGVPDAPGENRLAVRTEDHPLEYLEFEGDIPEGTYGAGTMRIWDRGTYACEKWEAAKLDVELRGERVQGRYALFRMRDQDWMIHRVDPPADPERRAMPERLVPMRARGGELPGDEGWAFEIRWDGIRAMAHCEPGRVGLRDLVLQDLLPRFPELRALARAVGHRWAVLDGEIVAFDDRGRPDRERLEERAALTSERAIRRRADADPVVYVMYDLLHLEGRSLLDLPYDERRERLLALELEGRVCRAPAHHVGQGAALLEAGRGQGLPGIVAKRLDSPYEPGRRTAAWLEIGADPRPLALPDDEALALDDYYARVAPALLPHLHERERRADGVELFASLALAGDRDRPTAVVLALEGGGMAGCCEAALLLRGMLDQLGLRCFAKTSGVGGLDLHVPVNVKTTYKRTQAFARAVAQTLERARPDGDVRVDWSLNDRAARPVCAYSLRAGKRKTVSTPLSWAEVESRDARALTFGPKAVVARVEDHGDLFAPVLSLTQELPAS